MINMSKTHVVNDAPHFRCILKSDFFNKVASVDSQQDKIQLDKSIGTVNNYVQYVCYPPKESSYNLWFVWEAHINTKEYGKCTNPFIPI